MEACKETYRSGAELKSSVTRTSCSIYLVQYITEIDWISKKVIFSQA